MKKIVHILSILSIVAFLSGCGKQPAPETAATPEGEAVLTSANPHITLSQDQMDLAGIELGVPERRMMSTYVECTGKVEVPPQSLASVYSPVNGFVKTLRYLPGDYVKKGTLLATLSHPDLVRMQRDFLECKSRLGALESDYRRKESLAGAEAASQRALEQARADYETERARYQGLRAEIQLIGLSAEQLEKTGEIQSTLSLYAPVNGYVNAVNINLGKLVTPNDLLYEIVDDSHVHLELQVYAKDVDKIRKEQRIEAWMPGREKIYSAEVHLIGRMIDPDTKTTLVHGHFSQEPVPITPGTFMHAHIYTDEAETLVVPATGVVRSGEEAFVFIQRDGGFEKRKVETGRTDGDYVEVRNLQLAEGEKIAVKGAYYINGSHSQE